LGFNIVYIHETGGANRGPTIGGITSLSILDDYSDSQGLLQLLLFIRKTPTTAAATWTERRARREIYIIAFGATCVGPGTDDPGYRDSVPQKKEMRKLRCEHISRMKIILGLTEATLHLYSALDGNCSEWMTWPIIIGAPGSYLSLCFGRQGRKIKSMKCCDNCSNQSRFLATQGVQISDLWEYALLVDKGNKFHRKRDRPYPSCWLESTANVVRRSIQAGFEEDIRYPDLSQSIGISKIKQ